MNFRTIPEELKKLKRWVNWKLEERTNNKGEKKWTKPPYKSTGEKADITDINILDTFYNVCNATHNGRGFKGIGFVFTGEDEYVGIDFDHVIDEQGNVDPDIKNWIEKFSSYTEYSQSKKGLHIICKGKKPDKKCRKGNIEIYSQGRYFALTGDVYNRRSEIRDCQKELETFYSSVFTEERKVDARLPIISNLTDYEIISLCNKAKNSNKFNALMSGDWTGYNSQSEADLALCNIIAFYTQDETAIDNIFRQSRLYRDKWNEKHGDDTYGNNTIKKALSGLTEVYSPGYGKNTPSSPGELVTEKQTEKLKDIVNFNYDSALIQDNKIEDNWIVKDLFARGVNFSVLFGEPGICKTWLILSEFLKLADGKTIFGKYDTEPKKTVLLEADFPSNVFEYRLKRLYRPENVNNFLMYSADKLQDAGREYCMDTKEGQEVIEGLMEREKPDILIIDSLGSWIQGDEVKQDVIKPVIEFLKRISKKFNLHIILIHHPRKRSNVERLNRLLDMSDATGSFLLARYASAIYTVNGLYDDEGRIDNKGLVINVKNWFRTSPKFEFSMEENEEGKMDFTFEYSDLTSFKEKKIGTKEAVRENLRNYPEGLSRKQIIKLIPNVSLGTIERALRELKKQKKIYSIGNTSNLIYKLTSDTQEYEVSVKKSYTQQEEELPSPLKEDEVSQEVKKVKEDESVSCFSLLHPEASSFPIQDKGKSNTYIKLLVSEKNDESTKVCKFNENFYCKINEKTITEEDCKNCQDYSLKE